jgi:para-aminobenzoate synthetase component I
MRETRAYNLTKKLFQNLLEALTDEGFNHFALFRSQSDKASYKDHFDDLIMFGNKHYGEKEDRNSDWRLILVPYDYKNRIENFIFRVEDKNQISEEVVLHPEWVIEGDEGGIQVHKHIDSGNDWSWFENFLQEIRKTDPKEQQGATKNKMKCRITKDEYLERIKKTKEHILKGDIYEMNYCMEFYADDAEINPFMLFMQLDESSSAPFSCFVKVDELYILSASPERYIGRRQNILFSSPIKGTIRRDNDSVSDELLKKQLLEDPKERAENVMIVDLVRNDLSRIAKKGSVKVDELFGIYTFPTVHQMISTVSCEISSKTNFDEILKATFPMGSMTGAPKIRAMQIIDELEETSRGWYSGTVGYIRPDGDFDFNVIIRSIIYNAQNKYLSFSVGSAITAASDPEKEYDECLLKAHALLKALGQVE